MSEEYFRVVKLADEHPDYEWRKGYYKFAWVDKYGESQYFEPDSRLRVFLELFFDCYWNQQRMFDHRWSREDYSFVKAIKIPAEDYDEFWY